MKKLKTELKLKNMKIDYRKIYKNKKILITGSTGFKGSWLSFLFMNLAQVIGVSKSLKRILSFLNH